MPDRLTPEQKRLVETGQFQRVNHDYFVAENRRNDEIAADYSRRLDEMNFDLREPYRSFGALPCEAFTADEESEECATCGKPLSEHKRIWGL